METYIAVAYLITMITASLLMLVGFVFWASVIHKPWREAIMEMMENNIDRWINLINNKRKSSWLKYNSKTLVFQLIFLVFVINLSIEMNDIQPLIIAVLSWVILDTGLDQYVKLASIVVDNHNREET